MSANSRSLNSISSNPSSSGDGKTSSKKRKTTQKTLGMAWGANSRSSSSSAFRNSPFSDFGSYMAVKNQKLHEQFDAAASSSSHSGSRSGNNIFSGVSIFVDGYTIPSSQELRGYMLKHGGKFENYFSRHRVTHIICNNLPDSKIKNLRAFSGGLPVVKPAWVLDSVAANKLLSWLPYQLDQLATENDNQPKLAAFFTPKGNSRSEIPHSSIDDQTVRECEDESSVKEDSIEQIDNYSGELCDLLQMNNEIVMSDELACSVESSCKRKRDDPINCRPLDRQDLKHEPVSCCTSVSICNNSMDNRKSIEGSSSRISAPPNQHHSTLTDPNFVENFFKSSRLHFIGTWRNRYRKRFPSLSGGFSCKKSHLNTDTVNKSAIIHIDMDCFFVSVIIRNHPDLLDKPVAVCHSDNPRGTSEISSANYPARDHGVKAGMFVKEAKIRCPQLVIVPYDFVAYETVADQFYDILHKHCNKVQAVSCDEAFLDVTESEVEDPQLLASMIRKEIFDTTGCTASAGIAGNMLLARLATRTAKPDGQCYISPEKVDDYLCALPVKVLPGIGHVLEAKLEEKQIKTCGQLRLIAKDSLHKDFGKRTGEMLWNYSRGIDSRPVGLIQETKSIGAEVNWGVRFRNSDDTRHFIAKLCKEVTLRLHGCGVQGRSFTLKIKKRRSDAREPIKYMGHGDCENLSHTITVPMATDDVDVLQRLATQLFGHFNIDVKDIRGMGLQVSKLEGVDNNGIVRKKNSILPWLVPRSVKAESHNEIGLSNYDDAGQSHSSITGSSIGANRDLFASEVAVLPHNENLPRLPDLDMSVIEALPPEVVSEINEMYGGKLFDFISENKSKTASEDIAHTHSTRNSEAHLIESNSATVHHIESNSATAHLIESNSVTTNEHGDEARAILPKDASFSPRSLMPSSLSQVDCSMLQQLPDELRKDIVENLPQHREPENVKDVSGVVTVKQINSQASQSNNLWTGSPPMWVEKFRISSCSVLSNFAMMYQSGSGGCLSSLLQCMNSWTSLSTEIGADGFDVAVNFLCDLIKQYIDLKIATDIEEIYCCACLLRRLTGKSGVFLEVYNTILPALQESMNDKYGGTLSIPNVQIIKPQPSPDQHH